MAISMVTHKLKKNKYPRHELAYQDKDLRRRGDFIYRVGKRLVIGSVSILVPPLSQIYHKKYEKKLHHLLLDSLLALIIWCLLVANIMISYWVYQEFFYPSIDIELSSQTENVVGGEEVTYSIDFDNNYKELSEVKVNLDFPKGFVFSSASIEPTNADGKAYEFEILKSKELCQLEISGKLYGIVGEEKILKADVSYQHDEFSLRQLVENTLTIAESNLDLNIILPETIISGKDFAWSLLLTNNSQHSLSNLAIGLENLPVTFTTSSASASISDNTLYFTELAAESSVEVSLVSRFQSIEKRLDFIAQALIEDGEEYFLQQEIPLQAIVVHPSLTLQSTVNQATDQVITKLGDQLDYQYLLTNSGDVALENIEVKATVQSPLLNKSSLEISAGGVFSGEEIVWQVLNLNPNQTTALSYSIKTVESNPGYDLTKIFLQEQASASAQPVGFSNYQMTDTGDELSVRIGGSFSFSAYIRYYDDLGGQVGYGPNPPMADETTAYRVFWNLTSIDAKLENLIIVTTLPTQVTWTNRISTTAGDALQYDPATRKVSWHVGKIIEERDQALASFEVEIIPNQLQIGKQINLIETSSVYINNNLIKQIDSVRTDKAVVGF